MTPHRPWPALLALAAATSVARADAPSFEGDVRPLIKKTCAGCHGGRKPKAGINLEKFADGAAALKESSLWALVADALEERTMPPEGKAQPEESERQRAAQAIRALFASAASVRDPGPAPMQRLTRDQYNNTIRDLLGVDTRPADAFPADGGGGAGFDNNAATLFVPPILLERYLEAAGAAVERADASRWKVASPDASVPAPAAARRIVLAFASRAFRRPVTPTEVDRLMGVYRRAGDSDRDFDSSVKAALKAALVSPRFLFLVEPTRPSAEGMYRVDDYSLASRLSYFLWSSMPDAELFALASSGTLHEPETLKAQVRRMLEDPRARALAEGFAGQWLGVGGLKISVEPDRTAFPEYDDDLRESMIEEPVATFEAIIRGDRPLLDLLDGPTVHVNERLARHYGLKDVSGSEFREVPRATPSRGGLLGMAGVLTLTSYPQRTSPVLRGRWVLDELLGTPPPPPPNDVKVLSPEDAPKDGKTFRQRLEHHRRNPGCAGCHAKLDPLGFGLESFDPIGRVRTGIGGGPLDDSGVLTTGEAFSGPAELKRVLMEKKRGAFLRNLASRMLSYAIRRGLEPYDGPTVDRLVRTLDENGSRSTALIVEIVLSDPFLYRRDAPIPETPR